LESQSESEQIELYEEKLKLTEAELLCSQQRAEIAESQGETTGDTFIQIYNFAALRLNRRNARLSIT